MPICCKPLRKGFVEDERRPPWRKLILLSSTSTMATDDPPLIVHTFISTSSSLMTTPSSPSSNPSTITAAATLDEMLVLCIPPNPSPLVAFVTSSENMVAEVTTNPYPLFPILLEISLSVSLVGVTIAPSPPISSTDSDIPSISNTPHFPSSFSFASNIPTGDDIPSPTMSWSTPSSLSSVPQGIDILPSSHSKALASSSLFFYGPHLVFSPFFSSFLHSPGVPNSPSRGVVTSYGEYGSISIADKYRP